MANMTYEEKATKAYLEERLAEQGYFTYSELFHLFDLKLTYDPDVIGYMEPGKARITINGTLEEHQMLLTIRHEILHEYLTHEMRLIEHVAKNMGLGNPDTGEISISDITDAGKLSEIKDIIYSDSSFNIAGDYEISNLGYTEQDKKDLRRIKLGGRIVSGLVTEDQHPDWVDLSLEEMYDLLTEEREQARQQLIDEAKKTLDDIINDPDIPQDIKDAAQATKDLIDKADKGEGISKDEFNNVQDALDDLERKYEDKDEGSKEDKAINDIKDILSKCKMTDGGPQGPGGPNGPNGPEGQGDGPTGDGPGNGPTGGSGNGPTGNGPTGGGSGDGPTGEGPTGDGPGDGPTGEGPGGGGKPTKGKGGKGQGDGDQPGGEGGEGDKPGKSSQTASAGGKGSDGKGKGSGQRDQKSTGAGSRIIHGTFRNGKFYDTNGNEITPGR